MSNSESNGHQVLRRAIMAVHSHPEWDAATKNRKVQRLMMGQTNVPLEQAEITGHESITKLLQTPGSTPRSALGGCNYAPHTPCGKSGHAPTVPYTVTAEEHQHHAQCSSGSPNHAFSRAETPEGEHVPVAASALPKPENVVRTWHDKDKDILGCEHYMRNCQLRAKCCGKYYTCRLCHDEHEDHTMDRYATDEMRCMGCGLSQTPRATCRNTDCGMKMARYYCKICKLWDDEENKNIYHCDKCRLCRIGQGLGKDYFHCDTCNVCMSICLKNAHRCIERSLESDCPICGEYMFTSTRTVMFMQCGHCMHYNCYSHHIQNSYQCPLCLKSLGNMTRYFERLDEVMEAHPMPPEFVRERSYVLCNDCERKSNCKYHFLYHRCAHCASYNTTTLKTFTASSEKASIDPQQPRATTSSDTENSEKSESTRDNDESGMELDTPREVEPVDTDDQDEDEVLDVSDNDTSAGDISFTERRPSARLRNQRLSEVADSSEDEESPIRPPVTRSQTARQRAPHQPNLQ
eukprot:Clim_evm74s243 gene=Clim_evmTU74s243